eukprot:CAMPEP_0171467660 /NCGR_PEP_ID=MMETSP0945-20130129/10118_1 /TAXON_ID=109269 /ORGANISM="Vaucheria litorea, Strain CCMP2940" /LENGTH=176 /DNA_ID=CAMNT_0011996249 /DNA_START=180 /DNA_END=707 /DNA_ORIENTATION=+
MSSSAITVNHEGLKDHLNRFNNLELITSSRILKQPRRFENRQSLCRQCYEAAKRLFVNDTKRIINEKSKYKAFQRHVKSLSLDSNDGVEQLEFVAEEIKAANEAYHSTFEEHLDLLNQKSCLVERENEALREVAELFKTAQIFETKDRLKRHETSQGLNRTKKLLEEANKQLRKPP